MHIFFEINKQGGLIMSVIGSNIRKCQGPACMIADLSQTDLKVCSRCKQSFYCSRECQSQDWTIGRHKEVCVTATPSIGLQVEKAVGSILRGVEASEGALSVLKDRQSVVRSEAAAASEISLSSTSADRGAPPVWERKGLVKESHAHGLDSINLLDLPDEMRISAASVPFAGGSWEARKNFLNCVLEHILQTHAKQEPLSVISLGSSNLLMEYLLAIELMERGYSQVSYFFVDPGYRFGHSTPLCEPTVAQHLGAFRKHVEGLYMKKYAKELPDGSIRFISRAPNVCRYIPKSQPVVLIESLPVYAQPNATIVSNGLQPLDSQDIIGGGFVVPVESDHMNTFALLPARDEISDICIIPSLALEGEGGNPFLWNAGVKIQKNGSYIVHMQGIEESLPKLAGKQLAESLRQQVRWYLDQTIARIQQGNPNRQLTDSEVAYVIKGIVQKGNVPCMSLIQESGMCRFFYAIDYTADRKDMLSGLLEKGKECPHATALKLEARGNLRESPAGKGYAIVKENLLP